MSILSNKKTLHTIIGLAIMFVFWFFPAWGTVTELGWRILGLFIGTIYLWSVVDTVWPSFLAVIMYVATGYTNVNTAFSSAFGTPMLWMIISILAMFAFVSETGLGERITANLLTLKFLQGHPWMFTFFFFIIEAILANTLGGIATVLLMWSILEMMKNLCHLENGHPYLHLMGIGVAIFSAGSQCILAFRNSMLIAMVGMCGGALTDVNYAMVMFGAIPIVLALMIGYVLMMRFVFRCDVSFLNSMNFSALKKELGPMGKEEKMLLIVMLAWLVTMTVGSLAPAKSLLGVIFARMGGIYGTSILFFILGSIVTIDGKSLVSFQKAAGKVPWGVVLMIAVAMSIGTPLMSAEAGIKPVLVSFLSNLLVGGSPIVLIAAVLFAAVVLTNISNNMVIAFMLCPIFVTINEVTPIPLMACLALLSFAANFAIVLPAASPIAAILFANEKLVAKKNHFKFTIPIATVSFIILMVVGYPIYTALL